MKIKFVDRQKIIDLVTVYMPRRLPMPSKKSPACIYKGIVYRGDPGFSEHGMAYFFQNGFGQNPSAALNGVLDFDWMNGFSAAGHTGKYGISTTSDYHYAASWCSKHVYIIDLTEHPFAIDINHTARVFNFHVDKSQSEVNVANYISKEQIFGHYDDDSQILTFNPNYKGIIEPDLWAK